MIEDRNKRGSLDFESSEIMIRNISHLCGANIIKEMLKYENGANLGNACECGGHFVVEKRGEKKLHTILGEVEFNRQIQRCNKCKKWRIPSDIVLDVVNTGFSPGLRKMMANIGAQVCFDKAHDLLFSMAGVRVTAKDVERTAEAIGEDILQKENDLIDKIFDHGCKFDDIFEDEINNMYVVMDGTGVPVMSSETAGRKGKAEDGIARTREAKLGAVFIQTTTDKNGEPIRDDGSTSYVGSIETSDEFGKRLYMESLRRGISHAKKQIVLGDGAAWVWNLADTHFPDALQIVDFFHSAEHLGIIAALLYPNDKKKREKWWKKMRKKLADGKVNNIINELRNMPLKEKEKAEMDKALTYFENNKDKMHYDRYRREGLFIGSGVIEAGCKCVIGIRLKQSGMHWSVRGANAIIALRCLVESAHFEDYWENRCAA